MRVPAGSREEVELALARAGTSLLLNYPFHASIWMRLERHVDTEIPTMETDGTGLWYNPEFVTTLDRDELITVLCHEVEHIALLHPFRCGARDPGSWNYFADAVVNGFLEQDRMKMPQGSVPGVTGKSVEEIYMLLPKGEDGKGRKGRDPGGMGGVKTPKNKDGSAKSKQQMEQSEQEAKVMVKQAMNAAKAAGKMPAGLQRLIDQTLEPKVPWREILAQFIDRIQHTDYNWTVPNRRYLHTGMILPSLHNPAMGKVALCPDTSGSMDQKQLAEAATELLELLNEYTEQGQEPNMPVLWFDHAVYPQIINDADELHPRGGGGTSFRVVFDHLKAMDDATIQACVMVTDGYCGDFGEPPEGMPVLWILTQNNKEFHPPFGEIAYILNE